MSRLFATLIALLIGTAISAQNLDATNPFEIVKLLREDGYRAELGEDADGYPAISGRISRTNRSLYFYDCDDPGGCTMLQFSAGWELDTAKTAERINEWNRSKVIGNAFVDESGSPFLTMFVNLDMGVSHDNLRDTVDWWRIIHEEFEDFIAW